LIINQASIDDPPTDLNDAKIVVIFSVNQMAQTSLDGLDTSGSPPIIQHGHDQNQAR
jgi:hypothetical protein